MSSNQLEIITYVVNYVFKNIIIVVSFPPNTSKIVERINSSTVRTLKIYATTGMTFEKIFAFLRTRLAARTEF
jgi:hypothetical protein